MVDFLQNLLRNVQNFEMRITKTNQRSIAIVKKRQCIFYASSIFIAKFSWFVIQYVVIFLFDTIMFLKKLCKLMAGVGTINAMYTLIKVTQVETTRRDITTQNERNKVMATPKTVSVHALSHLLLLLYIFLSLTDVILIN